VKCMCLCLCLRVERVGGECKRARKEEILQRINSTYACMCLCAGVLCLQTSGLVCLRKTVLSRRLVFGASSVLERTCKRVGMFGEKRAELLKRIDMNMCLQVCHYYEHMGSFMAGHVVRRKITRVFDPIAGVRV
jgi:hypothetical protein